MQSIDHFIVTQNRTASSIRLLHWHRRFWRVPAVLLITVSVGLAQVPFTEVANPGDIALDFYYNFGASWGDFNEDGDMDLFIANALQQGNFVYRNNGDLTFTRLTGTDIGDLANDVGDTGVGIWADIENDGDLDLFLANYSTAVSLSDYGNPATLAQPNRLYLNNGDNTFTKQADTLFGPPHEFANGASMADFDGDGFLDIFVATWPLDGSASTDTLYRNDGALAFSRVDGLNVPTVATSGGWFDYDGDGDLDILIPNNQGSGWSWLYSNQKQESGVATFTALSRFTNGATLGANAMNADWGDYDNDGDIDFILTHWNAGVDLFTNEGNGAYIKNQLLPASIEGARGGAWLDYDNDGDLDLIIQSTAFTGSWGQFEYLLVENHGGGSFTQHVLLPDLPSGEGRGPAALADINNDGFMDLFIAHYTDGATGTASQERDRLLTNDGNTNHWLKLVLEGTDSNRSGVGAIVRVLANIGGTNVWQMREVRAGGSLYVQHDPRPNFGLGDATVADVARIEWPSGTVQELINVAADQILHVTEPPRIRVDSPNTISWPASAEAFQLQSASQAAGPWGSASEVITVEGGRLKATLQQDGSSKFFRLHFSE